MFEDLVNEHLTATAAEEVCGFLILFGFLTFPYLLIVQFQFANFVILIAGERAWED
jgi:hypothetical protein